MPRTSYLVPTVPGAVLADGPLVVPLFAVSTLSLAESYHLPPVGSDARRVLVETHDDTISMSAALVGPARFIFKAQLELLAEQSMRGSVLELSTNGNVGGLVLWTRLTIRTDIYVKALSFTTRSARRDVIDVSLTLEHLPRPGGLAKGLDLAGAAVSSLVDPLL